MCTLNYYVPFFVIIMVESELKVLEREALWHSVVEVQYGVVCGLDGALMSWRSYGVGMCNS